MGTADPLVRIEAATLSGGDFNQDRYAYGDGWAFVLDGASSFSEASPVHDGGWYAERLKCALARRLESVPSDTDAASIVARAIEEAAADHDSASQGPCPTSTIAMALWKNERVELYILGDSLAEWCDADGLHRLTDDRIMGAGQDIRREYRKRLDEGRGFDGAHIRMLGQLQKEQQKWCNTPGGYWIAGDNPAAAKNARRIVLEKDSLQSLALLTDGVVVVDADPITSSHDLDQSLLLRQAIEGADPRGVRYPRSKSHDDKTAILINFNGRPYHVE